MPDGLPANGGPPFPSTQRFASDPYVCVGRRLSCRTQACASDATFLAFAARARAPNRAMHTPPAVSCCVLFCFVCFVFFFAFTNQETGTVAAVVTSRRRLLFIDFVAVADVNVSANDSRPSLGVSEKNGRHFGVRRLPL